MSELRWEEFQDALEYGGTLRFAGSPREVSEQLLLAAAVLRDKAYSGGMAAIDYEIALDQVQTSCGEGFGGWLQNALPTLIEIREVVAEAVSGVTEDWRARAWLAIRQPLPEKVTEREFSAQTHIPKTTVHRAVGEVDRLIVEALRARGYVIRG